MMILLSFSESKRIMIHLFISSWHTFLDLVIKITEHHHRILIKGKYEMKHFFYYYQVKKVNGVEVDNLRHLCQLIENCDTENLKLDLDDGRVLALKYQDARLATSLILKRHRIASAMSSDLLIEQNNLATELAASCSTAVV